MASAASSGSVSGVALLTVCIAVLFLLRHYLPLRSAPAFLLVPAFLAIALPASAILLVPIDLASSARVDDEASKGIWLPQRMVLVLWRIIYWLTFVLTWLILPLLGEYMDAGYRDPQSRIFYSLRSNGRYQLIMLACATAGLVYMIFSYGFDPTAIKGLVMALAYVWGLILAIYLMGHGLVAIPRKMIRNANVSDRLRRVQAHAPSVHEKLEDAVISLEDVEAQIEQLKKRKTGSALEFQEWIDDLADTIGNLPPRVTLATPDLDPSTKIPAVITERYLADLTRRFNRARHQRARYIEEWDRIVQTAHELQLILDAKASKQLIFNTSVQSSGLSRFFTLTPTLRYHLHANVIPTLRIVLGGLLALASLAIVQSEIIRFPAPSWSAISITVIHHPDSENYQIGFGGQIFAAFWILYMVACTLSSISDVPVWNQRALVRRNTYAESACWYAGQIARLTVPLAYNLLTMLPIHIQKQTTFYNFLGRLINLTPLGKWFDYLFPIFILVPVSATLFNLYGRIKNVLGFGIIEDEDEDEENNPSGFGTGGWREGRDLIARDLEGHRGASNLGLLSPANSSPRGSSDVTRTRSPRWASPARPGGSASSAGAPSRSLGPSNLNPNATRASRQTRSQPVLDPEPEEENFFTLFGRRVKNTFDTLETPRWMQGNAQDVDGNDRGIGFARPKWMGGDTTGTSSTGTSSGDDTNFFDRLFNANRQGNDGGSSGRIVL